MIRKKKSDYGTEKKYCEIYYKNAFTRDKCIGIKKCWDTYCPGSIPKQSAEIIQGYVFFSFEISRDEYISIGKNTSFICSQMDSLTGVKSPAITFLFVHSYRKCESVPVIKTKIIPAQI